SNVVRGADDLLPTALEMLGQAEGNFLDAQSNVEAIFVTPGVPPRFGSVAPSVTEKALAGRDEMVRLRDELSARAAGKVIGHQLPARARSILDLGLHALAPSGSRASSSGKSPVHP